MRVRVTIIPTTSIYLDPVHAIFFDNVAAFESASSLSGGRRRYELLRQTNYQKSVTVLECTGYSAPSLQL